MANKDSNGHGNWHREVDYEYMKFAEFYRANPLSFWGTYDPDATNKWIKEIEKIFSLLTCTKEQKVLFAAFMLKADAKFW